jgi:LacI family transcriptional regulator
MEQCVHRLIQRSVDGVAIMTSEFDPAIIEQLTRLNVPTVFLDVGTVAKFVSNIHVDYERGIRQGVEHLIGLGHRRIGFISGPSTLKSARVRKEAFLRALRDAGVADDPCLMVAGNHAIDGGLEAMEVLMRQKPTAVLASNDLTAIGALRAIRRAGCSVPRDISVVGFDDIQLSRFTDPPLTTVRVSRAEIAVAAFEALSQTYDAPGSMGCNKQVSTTLVVRESTGPVPLGLTQELSASLDVPVR